MVQSDQSACLNSVTRPTTASTRDHESIGFTRCSWNPAFKASWRSSSRASEVSAAAAHGPAAQPGGCAFAFLGSPTVSGSRQTDKPNVILYIIDGGGADYMSLYGYNRRTIPTLEKLAAEGAVFEHAYSTATWTKPSTTSFMTSLHNSVFGNT
jgi:hypothetical protein